MRSKKYIVGRGDLLGAAVSDWIDTGINDVIIPIELELKKDYSLDFSIIHNLSPVNATAFVVWGNDFMNFQRLDIFTELKKIGFKLPPLICNKAKVDRDVKISENVYVASGVHIGFNSSIGFNTVIMQGVIVGSDVVIGNSCFVDIKSVLKSNVILGDYSVIGLKCMIGKAVEIKKNTYINSQSEVLNHINENTYLNDSLSARVY